MPSIDLLAWTSARLAELMDAAEADGVALDDVVRAAAGMTGSLIKAVHGHDPAEAAEVVEQVCGQLREFLKHGPTPRN